MKNLKKINRVNLTEVGDGVVVPKCPDTMYLVPYNGYYTCCKAPTDNPC